MHPEERSPATTQTALEIGYLLDEYRIEEILGFGGFGITYKAVDSKDRLATQVAIKEYFPRSVAVRQNDRITVSLHHENERQDFDKGLQRFIEEAQVLRQFRHPAVVKVLRLYEKNGTAYMIMEYVPGETLEYWMEQNPNPKESQLKEIFQPVLEGLEYVHDRDYLHRDIKPQNIYIRQQGGAMLLDFGSARQSMGQHTAMVTPGFAPFEQYHSQNLGPWSDIYGVGASLYYCINGMKAPVDTLNRFGDLQQGGHDPLPSATEIGKEQYSEVFLSSIDWMLQPLYQNRPQKIAVLKDYWAQDQAQDHSRVDAITIYPEQLSQPEFTAYREVQASQAKPAGPFSNGVKIAAGLVAVLLVSLSAWLLYGEQTKVESGTATSEQAIAKVLDEEPELITELIEEKPVHVETKPPQVPQTSPSDKIVIQQSAEETLPEEAITPNIKVEKDKSAFVRLRINSQPRDAIVSIDGVDKGLTPLTVKLDSAKISKAQISLRKRGYRVWKNNFELEKNKNAEIFAQLSAITRPSSSVKPKPPVVQKPKSKLDKIIAQAKRGDANAQAKLGQRYETGRDVQQDYRLAAQWYKKAAYNGHVVAQLNLGYLYDKGKGVNENPAEAVNWYVKSARQGNSIAQTNLGLMYERGRGVRQNYAESIRWYRRAANQGNPSAQNAIGLLYIKGRGLRRNYRQAANWFRKAVDQNHSQAQVNLGLLYERGLGVRKNKGKAIQYYQQAASQGNRQAKTRLSRLGY